MRATYILGEDKHIKILVHSTRKERFEVIKAEYILKNGDNVEDSGPCEIIVDGDKNYLDAKISPHERSRLYKLEVTFWVLDEIRKVIVDIEVI